MNNLDNSSHLLRYLTLIPGPSRELYRILATSILSKELFTLLEEDQALTSQVLAKVILEQEMIRPILNKGSFNEKSLKIPSMTADKKVVFPNSQDFNKKLDELIDRSNLQKYKLIKRLENKIDFNYLIINNSKSVLESRNSKKLVQECSIESLIYYIKKYNLPWLKVEEKLTSELSLTLNTLYLEGGIYNNINTLYITSKKLL